MKVGFLIRTIFFIFFLAGCQVKEKTGTGLISGHLPTTNSFSVSPPTNDTYTNTDVISFTLSFPYEVDVTGTPRLSLTIGATPRYANYISGSGTKNLLFQYTVVAADNDADGIQLAGLGLNGGTLNFTDNGVTSPCDVSTVTAATYSSVLVDNTAPTITNFVLSTTPGFYNVGDVINFTVTFSEPVYVTGSPKINLTFNTAGSAIYSGGSGSASLSFQYTVASNQFDTNGYAFSSTNIDLNSGTIVDGSGIAAPVSLAAYTAAIDLAGGTSDFVEFDGRVPYVTDVVPPSNGTYLASQALDFTVHFDQPVSVSPQNYIQLTVGSATKQATYYSGSESNTIVFRYTLVPGDVDTNGIDVTSSITANGGTIASTTGSYNYYTAGTYSNNVLTIPSTAGILVNSPLPLVTGVTILQDTSLSVPGGVVDNYFISGENIDIAVSFNDNIYVTQSSGTPYIELIIGATTVQASYLSGGDGQTSLVFRYTVLDGQSDTDGLTLGSSIVLNNGTITNSALTNAQLTLTTTSFTNRFVDGIRPTISSITPPSSGTYSTTTGNNNSNMPFIVNWSEAVNYSSSSVNIPLTIGATLVNAAYSSGNNTATITHLPSALTGLTDNDGISASSPLTGTATIKDLHGNTATTPITFTPPSTSSIFVDTTAPLVNSVSFPSAGTYQLGDNLDFVVTFSETVDVISSGGYPRIALAFDSGTKYATYLSGSGTDTITFRYTIVSNDSDLNGITNPTVINVSTTSSYIRDIGWNGYTTNSYAITANLAGIIVDARNPSISAKTTTAGKYVSAADGTNRIVVSVTYDEAVIVTGTAPYIDLDIATGDRQATYDSGTSTSTVLKFNYDIDDTADMDLDGLSLANADIVLPGGTTIQDTQGNDAALTLTTITNLSSVFIVPHIVAWMKGSTTNISGFTIKPTISTTATLSSGYYNFDGSTDTLSVSNINSTPIEYLYMAIRTPAGADAYPQEMISGGDLTLSNNTIDMTTTSSPEVTISSGIGGSGNSYPSAFPPNTTQQMELYYSGGISFPNAFTPNTFSGGIAEMIFVDSPLSSGQRTHVYDYINNAYP